MSHLTQASYEKLQTYQTEGFDPFVQNSPVWSRSVTPSLQSVAQLVCLFLETNCTWLPVRLDNEAFRLRIHNLVLLHPKVLGRLPQFGPYPVLLGAHAYCDFCVC